MLCFNHCLPVFQMNTHLSLAWKCVQGDLKIPKINLNCLPTLNCSELSHLKLPSWEEQQYQCRRDTKTNPYFFICQASIHRAGRDVAVMWTKQLVLCTDSAPWQFWKGTVWSWRKGRGWMVSWVFLFSLNLCKYWKHSLLWKNKFLISLHTLSPPVTSVSVTASQIIPSAGPCLESALDVF